MEEIKKALKDILPLQVREHEVVEIQKVFKESQLQVAFTYIIVSKRINSRFFKKDRTGFVNPPSGSVFDTVVTLPERYDFFLVSQSVRQGTVNPTSYNVIDDTSGWTAEIIQSLSYKMTHLYYNWPGTVSYYFFKLTVKIGARAARWPSVLCSKLTFDLFCYRFS